jgi:hypothetical protein
MLEFYRQETFAYSSAAKIFVNVLVTAPRISMDPVQAKTVDKVLLPPKRAASKAFRADALWKN